MAKCQLCGGKIRDGRCSLCGWINQDKKASSRQTKTVSRNQVKTPKTSYKQKTYKKKKKMPVWLRVILIVVGISLFSDLLVLIVRWIEEIVYLFL